MCLEAGNKFHYFGERLLEFYGWVDLLLVIVCQLPGDDNRYGWKFF